MDGIGTLGRGQTYPLESYKKGVKVWIRDPERVWIGAELRDNVTFSTKVIRLQLENGDETEIKVKGPESLPFLRNPDILLGKDDLTTLSYLHEPAVLNHLNFRFSKRESIYTYCGIILVAINPYSNCSHLYSDEVIQVYSGVGKQVRELDPHIYAVAEEAFFDLSEYNQNQSIIVSGESGAGKTVSAKFVMRYLTAVAPSPKKQVGNFSYNKGGIENRVLASNPIMEAIGNAKTIRNDNSSRFGKFIQINFTSQFSVAGAQMKTYLLEKSRVVFQAYNERNYHIFYQLCASAEHSLLKDLHIGNCYDYVYTSQGESCIIEGIDDGSEFLKTVAAFDLLGISADLQKSIFRVLAGILLIGNIVFRPNEDAAVIDKSEYANIHNLCKNIYNIDESELRLWLTTREIRAAGEVLRKPLNCVQASASKDALAKMIYEATFTWIVNKVNNALMVNVTEDPQNQQRFIGVLDIYGFETFEINSFEQFCINYANEKLQQQFNQHVFKLEQSEYEREEIDWVRIDFYDNQPCIDLIESRPGIIDSLDEQCKMGRGTDRDWLEKLKNTPQIKDKEHFQLPRIKNPSFIIKHFAADVTYFVDGFLEKNRDSVSEQLVDVIRRSELPFFCEIFNNSGKGNSNLKKMSVISDGKQKPKKKCVSFQFRDSLRDLMNVLGSTRPHYVRCIKPNDEKLPFTFNPKRAIQQLRACGVLETVRISAAGYPSRWVYDDFSRRYRVLYADGKGLWKKDSKKFAEKTCNKHLQNGVYALGKTKVFFRTGQVALLERLRTEILSKSVIMIQKIWRGFVCRQKYQKMLQAIVLIQATGRAFIVYRQMKYMQIYRAAICIQAAYRKYIARKHFRLTKIVVEMIQTHYRGSLIRRKVEKLRYEQKAIIIQKYWRGWLVRRHQIERVKKIIKVQCLVRRWLAKRRLKELKIEARSVGHLQKLNTGLENKIISLQQRLDIMMLENQRLVEIAKKYEEIQTEVDVLQSERPALVAASIRSKQLEEELGKLEKKNITIEGQRNAFSEKIEELEAQLKEEASKSVKKVDSLNNRLSKLTNDYEKIVIEKMKLEQEFSKETQRRTAVEDEVAQMREQLLANASLLASPALSRVGSMRSSTHRSDKLNTVNGPDVSSSHSGEYGDFDQAAVILRQQHMLSELRQRSEQSLRENERLKAIMDANAIIDNLDKRASTRAFETQRAQELELAYSKLKVELDRIVQQQIENGYESVNFRTLIDKTLEENDRRREESAELRALLALKFERQTLSGTSPHPDSGHWSATHSDEEMSLSDIDEELCLERQCWQLKSHIEVLTRTVTERNVEIERLEKRLKEDFSVKKCAVDEGKSIEENVANVNTHLNHLVLENLDLQNRLNRQSDELSEVRAQLRGYTTGLGSTLENTSDFDIIRLKALRKESVVHSSLLEIFNVPEFTRIIIGDLKPRLARLLTPCLPAYLLLAAFRYHDHAKDEAGLTGLFTGVHDALKDTVMQTSDMDVLALWLVNSWRLFNLLRQYSGENNNEWFAANSEVQNSYRMQSFDLEPIRNQLHARVEDCFQSFMKRAVEPVLSPKIVPAILQHESGHDSFLAGSDDNNLKRQSSKDQNLSQKSLDDLVELLNFIHTKLKVYGADAVLLKQVFGQMAYWICALALNHLMFRKELCNFEKAIQIKHNVTEVQNWLSNNGFGEHGEILEPLVQASHLLQSKKDESNLDTLCGDMTSKLKPRQVISILQHYSPSDGFEERRMDSEFLIKVAEKLSERTKQMGGSEEDQNALIMMGTYLKPFDSEPFVYSDFPLETLSLPTCLHLQTVCQLL